jgi:hypothetical protein
MLSDLTASSKRLALVGLAKNTGKTVALNALLGELAAEGRAVGVTSVGRDGEERDAIDARIEKPRVRLTAGTLVATTDSLLRASGLAHETLEDTDVRTPLGRVLLVRLREAGEIEVAGPSAAADVRALADAMLAHGAGQALIDGAVDRRAASSPEVSDGLVMATGAVLDQDIEQVVAHTRDAVALVRLALAPEACTAAGEGEKLELAPRFVLTAEAGRIAALLDEHPRARWLCVPGALPERFLSGLLQPLHHRRREVTLVVGDPTKVFLYERGAQWYARQGVHLRVMRGIALEALTVNPVAPQSHSFDSGRLCERLREEIPGVPVFDVLHTD